MPSFISMGYPGSTDCYQRCTAADRVLYDLLGISIFGIPLVGHVQCPVRNGDVDGMHEPQGISFDELVAPWSKLKNVGRNLRSQRRHCRSNRAAMPPTSARFCVILREGAGFWTPSG